MANKTIKDTLKILDNDFEDPFKKLKLLNTYFYYSKIRTKINDKPHEFQTKTS